MVDADLDQERPTLVESEGRLFVAWSETRAGRRVVRAAVHASDGRPMAAPFDVAFGHDVHATRLADGRIGLTYVHDRQLRVLLGAYDCP